jgi:sec-independent protein translocase protein TatC
MKHLPFYTQELQYRSSFLLFTFFLNLCAFYMYSPEYIIYCVQPLKINHLIFTDISEAFRASIEMASYCAFFLLFPSFLYQIFCFLAPGFFLHERKISKKKFAIFLILWFCSFIFASKILLPIFWQFFAHFEFVQTDFQLEFQARILPSLQFVFQIFLWNEFLFFLPPFIVFCIQKDILNKDILRRNRNILYFVFFLMCGFLCPPEFFLQMTVSILCVICFEILVFCTYMGEFYMHSLYAGDQHLATNHPPR